MRITPDFDCFEKTYDAGRPQLLWHTQTADLETAVGIMLKLTQARKDSFLLESVRHGRNQTQLRERYSIIGLKPDLVWRCTGNQAEVNRKARWNADAFEAQPGAPLESLRQILAETTLEIPDHLPPMAAGLFGYFGYDMIRQVEHLPNVNPDKIGAPDAILLRPTIVVIMDAVKDEVTFVTPVYPSEKVDARNAYNRAAENLADIVQDLERRPQDQVNIPEPKLGEAKSSTTREQYFDIVKRAKKYILDGDIFQVVPSQRWRLPFNLPAFSFYRVLRRVNPSPYMFFFNFGGFQIAGASPEILVQKTGQKITIRPIAGTRPRGQTNEEDQALETELLADPKERAEHLMLIDLGRNDVGRVAEVGTVDLNARYTIEYYSHVMHIVSNVDGQLQAGLDCIDALLAGLPAGTVSGAPKIRAMEIIDELETEKRGVYAGGVGYFSANGDMDMCIALRTAVLQDDTLLIQAGGGIVHDSDPEAEYQETVNKARALFRAAELTYRDAQERLGQMG